MDDSMAGFRLIRVKERGFVGAPDPKLEPHFFLRVR
jgi:hypothetical protein